MAVTGWPTVIFRWRSPILEHLMEVAGERERKKSVFDACWVLSADQLWFSKWLKKFLREEKESMDLASWLVSVWPNHLAGTLIHERGKKSIFHQWLLQENSKNSENRNGWNVLLTCLWLFFLIFIFFYFLTGWEWGGVVLLLILFRWNCKHLL